MRENKCLMCGATFIVNSNHPEKQFCNSKCYGAYKHLNHKEENHFPDDPDLGKLTNIHPDGYNNLVLAIVKQAKEDVLSYPPESRIRQDAEEFFLSEHFEQMTELDGFEILYRLSQQYDAQHRKKGVRNERARNA